MSLFNNVTNSNGQGNIGMGHAIAWFTKNGYTVCIPLTDSQSYDIVVTKKDSIFRVQVKTTRCKKNNYYRVGLTTTHKNKRTSFDPTGSELLYILTETGTEYLIPTSILLNSTSLTLGQKYDKYIV